MVERTAEEQNKEKRIKINENRLRDLWDNIKHTNVQIIRVSGETSLSLFTFMHWRRKWQPTPVFLPGESQNGGAWWAAVYGVAQSWTRLKQRSSSSRRERV